jgi:hypothetical protein
VKAKETRKYDDHRDYPDNPIVPFRMSDRLEMYRLRWWLTGLTFLIGTGMALSFLHI